VHGMSELRTTGSVARPGGRNGLATTHWTRPTDPTTGRNLNPKDQTAYRWSLPDLRPPIRQTEQ
jgi:hypothetical protein